MRYDKWGTYMTFKQCFKFFLHFGLCGNSVIFFNFVFIVQILNNFQIAPSLRVLRLPDRGTSISTTRVPTPTVTGSVIAMISPLPLQLT